jgi:hypothetical protein
MRNRNIAQQSRRPELYIFVTAQRADPYVNVLTYLLRNRTVSAIHYVALIEHGYTTEQMEARLIDIEAGVGILLGQLAEGRYGDREIDLALDWVSVYRECKTELNSISVERLPISWDDLDNALREFLSDGPVMFDVTTLKKNLLVDVVALLLSRGWTDIRTFELVTSHQPKFDEQGLIHALGNRFSYRNLADSKHVEKARSRIVSNSLTFRTVLIITAGVALVVFIIQLFFANTALESGILALATVAAIAAWLFTLIRKE